MGSLNGDVVVMRNGRSTSQVSVYNYPEHLNPFYEDDQHKRLRFWKINKKGNEGRRNSFSIGNLKDMWSFKSFRMKKKSSTLGINKTSESPPLLRRDYALDNSWNTFDHRLRASNTSSINGDSFQRNVTYRSSLQTLPTNNDRIGLNRNDGYRSTIQVTRSNPRYQPQQQTMGLSPQNRRYVYGGSVTPQPFRNSRTKIAIGPYDCDNAMIRGSSQTSMVSRNPFESDDDENEDINSSDMISVINGSTTTLTSRTPRKKRRAPPPPTPIHGRSNGTLTPPIIRIEPSQDNNEDELRIKEDIDIANLTAEIENFVKTKSNDDVEVALRDEETSTTKSSEKVEVTNVAKQGDLQEITSAPKESSYTIITPKEIESPPKKKINAEAKSNGQITTEIVTITTTRKTTPANFTEPVEKETKVVAQVSNEFDTTTDESKENKSNGAIPKKPTNNSVAISSVKQQQQQSTPVVAELCIKETDAVELPQKPVPLKRQTKTEAEVGHVECIHVHVESPRATPRKDHTNGLSTFKTIETVEGNESIRNKTPFVLTSPPTHKRNRQQIEKEEPIIKASPNKQINELNIQEDRINAKPEILVKPTLSPKPVTKEPNGKIHGFAEIHKPMRRSIQNDRVQRASRDESISPPTVPEQATKEEKKIINNAVDSQTDNTKEQKAIDNLKIVETATYISSNGDCKQLKEKNVGEVKENNCENSVSDLVKHNDEQKRDDEFDLLYRPKHTSHMEWKHSSLAPLETNIPPEKRKSVKDIIESINRSQRLLNAAANKDFTALQNQNTTTKTVTGTDNQSFANSSNNNLNENLKILDERQKEMQCLVEEMALSSTDAEYLAESAGSPSPSPSNCNNEYTEAQKLDNGEIFQKCKVKKEVYDYRETSPISSNLDWNPVPKPKRTKPGHE